MKSISTKAAHTLMIVAMLLAASSFPVGALITNELPSEVLMFMRFFFAAILFSPLIIIKHGFVIPKFNDLLRYLMLSIPSVVFFWCMFESLKYTSVINTGALFTLVPLITAIYAFFLNKERVPLLRIFGLIVGVGGALWIVFDGDVDAMKALKLNYGDVIFVVGCLFTALHNPLVRKYYKGEPMEVMTFWILLLGSVLLMVVSWGSLFKLDYTGIKPGVYFSVAYLALFTTLTTFYIRQVCVLKIGATKVSAYGYLTPIFVIFIALVAGLDEFSSIIMPGVVLVIISMLVVQSDVQVKS